MERADPAQTGVRIWRLVSAAAGPAAVLVAAFGGGSPHRGRELLVQVTGLDARIAMTVVTDP